MEGRRPRGLVGEQGWVINDELLPPNDESKKSDTSTEKHPQKKMLQPMVKAFSKSVYY